MKALEAWARTNSIRNFWQRYKRNKGGVVGIGVVSFVLILAVFADFLAPFDPRFMGRDSFSPPSAQYLFGTDDLGRDVLSRVMIGSRVSLFVGFTAAAISTLIGILVGSISGFRGGKTDDLMMRFTEIFQVIPKFFLALVTVALFGSTLTNIVFVIAVLSWPSTARLARAQFLSLKQRPFVEAAQSMGASRMNIIFYEILPNALPTIIVNASLQISGAILVEAGLSFLGLSDPTFISWGSMLNQAQVFMRRAWWYATFPGAALFLTILSTNLIGDGLNDALNPKLRKK